MTGKSRLWSAALALYIRFRMRRAFHDVVGLGLDEAERALARGPAIVVMNHVAWWDPLLLVLLDQRLGGEGYALMATDSLVELPFFARVGAVPLNKRNARLALADLEAAAALLDRPGRFVVIFPSGEQRPSHFPLSFRGGVHRLAQKSGARLLPLAVRYEFLETPKPTLLYAFGRPFELSPRASPKDSISAVERRVGRELHRIDEAIAAIASDLSAVPPGLVSLLFPRARPAREGRIPALAQVAKLGAPRARSGEP